MTSYILHMRSVVSTRGVENLYHKANEEAEAVNYTVIKHSGCLRTLEKC